MDLPRPFGTYTLLSRLAVGGMAEIYIAKTRGHGGFEKLVAIKLVHPHLSADAHFVRMLIDEAKILVLLTHANIAQVFDLGCIDGTYYIAMEYVEGIDVHGLQRAAAQIKRQLPIPACCFIVAEMLQGLDYAHRKRDSSGKALNIVHRDISPQNVLISHAGEVKLVDFGIAKTNLRGEGTEAGVIKGKYYYMSPEQAWADPMDRRSDIFSTGIVLYEMLIGRMLYSAQSIPELIGKVREAEIDPPEKLRPDIPPALSKIVMRALEREPKNRYQAALDLGEALRDFLYETSPSFNAAKLSQFVSELLETSARALAASKTSQADTTGGLRALTRDEFVRNEDSVIFELANLLATRSEALPLKQRKDSAPEHPKVSQVPAQAPPRAALPKPRVPLPLPNAPRVVEAFHSDSSPPTEIMQVPAGLRRVSGWPLEDVRSSDSVDEPTEMWSAGSGGEETVVDSGLALQLLQSEQMRANGFERLAYRPADEAAKTTKWPASTVRARDPDPASGTLSWPSAPSLRPPPLAPRLAASLPKGVTPALVPPPGETPSLEPIPPSPPIPDFGTRGSSIRTTTRARLWAQIAVGLLFTLLGALAFQLMRARKPEPQLDIVSAPNGASVQINGHKQSGVTPLRITGLEAGHTYELRVELGGYLPWEATYHASPGAVQHIAVLKPITGKLHVTSEPSGADVWLDDVPIGKTPLTVSSLAVGRKVRLRVHATGHSEARREIIMEEKALEQVLKFALARAPRSRLAEP